MKATSDFFMDHSVSVGVSLDSPIKEVNDQIRPLRGGGGTYEAALHAIEHLDGYRAMSVICTISSMNVNTLPQMIDFLVEKKVPSVLMNPVRGTQESREEAPACERIPDPELHRSHRSGGLSYQERAPDHHRRLLQPDPRGLLRQWAGD